jgi:trimethylamine--corrinoid protein Co-methyltransferase
MMGMLLNGLAGMTLSQSLGTLAWGLYGSQEMVVICDEIAHMIKRVLAGISVSEETLAVDLIRKVGHGGDYLNQDHTFQFFKKELFFPNLFSRQTVEQWQESGGNMIHQVAHARVDEILSKAGPVDLLPGVDSELERALKNAIRLADIRDPRNAR